MAKAMAIATYDGGDALVVEVVRQLALFEIVFQEGPDDILGVAREIALVIHF